MRPWQVRRKGLGKIPELLGKVGSAEPDGHLDAETGAYGDVRK